MALRTITLRGFKSIASLENFEMRNINLLIGANGSGKSNFLSAFKFLSQVAQGNLRKFVADNGGPDIFLHRGRRFSQKMTLSVLMDGEKSWETGTQFINGYRVVLNPTTQNTFFFTSEEILAEANWNGNWKFIGKINEEAKLPHYTGGVASYVRSRLNAYRQYHFHDTSDLARVKQKHSRAGSRVLQSDGGNLAAFLSMLRSGTQGSTIAEKFRGSYLNIVNTIRMVAPFFGGFFEYDATEENIQLEWYEIGDRERIYNAHSLSDGTLRFICLTTLLLQPPELLPDTIIIDEPELGLHPYAISLLAEMIKQVAETKQVVIATQSVELLNHFAPEDVVVADREGAATVLRRLNADDLSEWLKSYSLGELWQKNVLGGRPV